MATSNKSKKILEKARKIAAKTKKKKSSKVDVKKKTSSHPEGQDRPQSKAYSQEADKTLAAKNTGWRWTKEGAKKLVKDVNSKPSQSDIEKYRGETFKVKGKTNKSGPKGVGDGSFRYIYIERRADKADLKRKDKLAKGGATTDDKKINEKLAIANKLISQGKVMKDVDEGIEVKYLPIKYNNKGSLEITIQTKENGRFKTYNKYQVSKSDEDYGEETRIEALDRIISELKSSKVELFAKGGKTKEFLGRKEIIGKKIGSWQAVDENGISIIWENKKNDYYFFATPGFEGAKELPIQIGKDNDDDFGIVMTSTNPKASYDLQAYLDEVDKIIPILFTANNTDKKPTLSDFKAEFKGVKNYNFKDGGYMAKGGQVKFNPDDIEKGDLVYFGVYGNYYVVNTNYDGDGELFWVTKLKNQRTNSDASGYPIQKFLAEKIVEKYSDLDETKGGKVTPKQVKDFKNYVKEFYGRDEMYSHFFPPHGATQDEIDEAVDMYVDWATTKDNGWGGGDSLDRERVRDIMLYNRYSVKGKKKGTYTKKGLPNSLPMFIDLEYPEVVKGVVSAKKEYGGILQPMTGGVNADPRFDIYNTTMFAEKGAEVPKGEYRRGGFVTTLDDAIATDELKGEASSKMGEDDTILNFAYTDYGGDFFDIVAIDYFLENYPENIVVENTGWGGRNAIVFGAPAQEFIEASESYLLGFDNIEDYYYQRQYEQEREDFERFLEDIQKYQSYKVSDEAMDWLMENRTGYFNITTTGVDFSEDDLINDLENEGLIEKETDDYAKGGGIGEKTLTRKYLQNKAKNVFTFGYGMPKDKVDMYGTKGGTEYFVMKNGDVYKKSSENRDKFILVGNESKFDNGGETDSGLMKDFNKNFTTAYILQQQLKEKEAQKAGTSDPSFSPYNYQTIRYEDKVYPIRQKGSNIFASKELFDDLRGSDGNLKGRDEEDIEQTITAYFDEDIIKNNSEDKLKSMWESGQGINVEKKKKKGWFFKDGGYMAKGGKTKGVKAIVTAVAYNPKTYKFLGKPRKEKIMNDNILFRGINSKEGIKSAYETYWNQPFSKERVAVLDVTIPNE